MNKTIVLFSGGLDSTTLIYNFVNTIEIIPLFIDYNQKALKEELKAFNYFCKKLSLNEDKVIVHRTNFFNESVSSFKNNSKVSSDFIYNRNLLFASIAFEYAIAMNAKEIAFGFIKKNTYNRFPDTSPEFIKLVNSLFKTCSGSTEVKFSAPLHDFYKWELLKIAIEKDITIPKTYSCYKDKRCGKCESCMEVKNAFLKFSDLYAQPNIESLNPYNQTLWLED